MEVVAPYTQILTLDLNPMAVSRGVQSLWYWFIVLFAFFVFSGCPQSGSHLYALMSASRSALTWSLCVVHMPCGAPL